MTGRAALRATAAAALLAVAWPSSAQQPREVELASSEGWMQIMQSEGRLLRLDRPAATVLLANPAVADVQIVSERTMFVLGSSAGRTQLIILDAEEEVIGSVTLSVTRSLAALHAGS
ncbi:pilus assembly protein N-terminal domain-containing protein [Jannaschia sp. LMIT008]|uniref:pilus assembly protein N-terminal domain-containing protein n=1 Tax=Jannaschia maritima TaxID=3032585 RepID=UPI00281200EE|nr:pilus assembly protein N-terminal domain-containing protein [Jannaschia sp. LMIT008]